MRERLVYLAISILFLVTSSAAYSSPQTIVPGVLWYDTSEDILSAHGPGVMKVGSTYYLVGEYMDNDPNNILPTFGGHVTHQFVANTCYSSTDFVNWTFENNLLTQQASGDLGPGRIVERPKVIYNDSTSQYVMYMHIDTPLYDDNRVGVATCPTVNGNYTYLGGFRPLGEASGDMTLFKDDDGKGYLISNNGLGSINIYELSTDYLSVSSLANAVRKLGAEAPAMFKAGGVYYLLCSDSSWWAPNDNFYFTATSITGRWSRAKDFTPNSDNTWSSQTTYVQPIQGSLATTYVFLADRWCEGCFGDSVYVWLPLIVDGTTLTVDWYDEWTLDAETGEWAPVPCTAGTTHVESIVCSTALGSQGKRYGQVTVTIYDNYSDPVVGADVTGSFTGSFNETVTERTDDTGAAVITTTTQVKQPTYTFCVDDVNHATLSYDPNDNVETCCSY